MNVHKNCCVSKLLIVICFPPSILLRLGHCSEVSEELDSDKDHGEADHEDNQGEEHRQDQHHELRSLPRDEYRVSLKNKHFFVFLFLAFSILNLSRLYKILSIVIYIVGV